MKAVIQNTLISILTVFLPIKAILITTFVLVIADLITGVLASRKAGIPITSKGFQRTVAKLALYQVAICLAFLAEKYMIGELFPVSRIASALVGMTELKSILENLDIINGSSLFKSLVSRLISEEKDKIEKK